MGAGDSRERYQPDTKLEAGLGGERWLATDTESGKVAVLAVLDARAATAAQRVTFEQWAKVGRTTSHPSLEKVVASGETALGNPYFATELVDTETLAQRIVREPAMSLHELVRVVTGVVDGLVLAHKSGLLHGDVSPERIHLLAGARAKLVGFGLNRATARAEGAAREAETLPSTDAYMSPEQARGGEPDRAADIWGVAAILYRGFTGVAPRALDDGRSTIRSIAEGPTVPVERLREDAPPSFASLLDKALSEDPAVRFADIGELRKALTSALILAPIVARMPVLAAPEPPSEERPSLDQAAPALPPPPSRPQTGIGPLGARTNQRGASARAGISRWATSQPPSGSAVPPAGNTSDSTPAPAVPSTPAPGIAKSSSAPPAAPSPSPVVRSAVVTASTQAIGKVSLVKANQRVVATEVNVATRRPSRPPPTPPVRPARSERDPLFSDPPPPLKPMDEVATNRTSLVEDDDGVVTSFGSAGLFWPGKDERTSGFARQLEEAEELDADELLDEDGDELSATTDDDLDAALAPVSLGAALPAAPSSPVFRPPSVEASPTPVSPAAAPTPVAASATDSAPAKPTLPPQAWASIAVFALGIVVAIAGIWRYWTGAPAADVAATPVPETIQVAARTPATPPTTEPAIAVPSSVDASVITPIDAGSPKPVAVDAGLPVPPPIVPEPAQVGTTGTPRVRPPRTTTPTAMTTTPAAPMTTPPSAPMTAPAAPMAAPMSSNHALERDPGF